MSTYYSVYAEVNIDGKWYNLCPYYKDIDGRFKTRPLFWAQSAFYEVNNDLQSHQCSYGIPDDMSEELRKVFYENLKEIVDDWYGDITWGKYYQQRLYSVNFAQAIVPRVRKDKPFKYEGYVTKKELASFECYEIEEFSEWLTDDEYKALTEKQKHQYVFHRWNDPFGDYKIYSDLSQRIWTLSALFQDAYWAIIGKSLLDGISDSQIRVYVYVS